MLTLTENARVVVANLVENGDQGSDAGLRIERVATSDQETDVRFSVSIAAAPAESDQVVEDAPVFLEEDAAAALSDKVLDARIEEGGTVNFSLLPQPLP